MNFSFENIYCLLSILLFCFYCETVLAENRIIGGHRVSIEKFPYMLRLNVGMKDGRQSVCGASIIGTDWGLTAAHCVEEKTTNTNKVDVIAGTDNIKKLSSTASKHKVTSIIRHEKYNKGKVNTLQFDIAVIKVNPPFTYKNVVQPVKLPEKGQTLDINFATVSGWGRTNFNKPGSDVLLAVKVPKVDYGTCKKKYGKYLNSGEICYGFKNGTVFYDKCNGDSGGPLVNKDGIELGLVSFGVKCGSTGTQGVYTDVQYYRGWIKEKTGI
ncbi:trypsin-7-like [Leptopilina heterotoma]|uniref:trypsin-7-like n=1 Tax=Leptopilina heterotoma TaxID=63436 RepID=UPI001CA9349B|nr:trypsin-7-like [Leptopilina heterotoma]